MHLLIYGLVDPRTDEVRYVGKSSWGLDRPRCHTYPSQLRARTHKVHWLRELLGAGVMPVIRVLEIIEREEDLNGAEIRWIAHGRALGWPLTNLTDGGDGASLGNKNALGTQHTDEWKADLAERMLGNQHALGYHHTPEWRALQSERLRGNKRVAGRVVPDDERARRTAAVQAAWDKKTAEDLAAHGAKISAAKIAAGNQGSIENLRTGWALEVRARAIVISADLRRGVALTVEHRAAISDGLRAAYADGRRAPGHSEETRRKISEAKRGRGPTVAEVWARRDPPCCRGCEKTERPHKGGGLCSRCYQRENS